MKESTFIKKVLEWFSTLSGTQIAVGATAAGLLVAGVIGGVVLMDALNTSNDSVGTESTEITESLYPAPLFGETETTEETEMTEELEEILVEITTTSIEKDLKIKIVDENGNLVKGFPFVVTVTPNGTENGKDYEDHDMDGIIHIKDLEGGEYKVLLQELEGILVEENEITATVKGQIEYKKVDVQNEIKDESQINVAVEDTANNNVVVEAPIVDTTPLVDSKVEATINQYDNVDISKLPPAVVSVEKNEQTLNKTAIKPVEIITPDGTEIKEDNSTTGDGQNTEGNTDASQNGTEGIDFEEGGSYSARAKGQSFATAGATQTVTEASVTVSIPKTVILYTVGTEASTTADISLSLLGDSSLIKSYSWSIENAAIAELQATDNQPSAKLIGKAEGTTNVVVHFEYICNENETIATYDLICQVTVSKHTDTTTQLVDPEGNKLYLDEAATKPATPADLGTASQFYKNPKYTGWQTIDGYLYYYNQDGVPVTGTQVIGGVNYEFHEDGKLKENQQSTGIDVSKWQGNIDWQAVANAGIDFAIIRCGYRGSSTGVIVEDPYFKANIKGATDNGIKVGVYFFTQAITEAEAVEEASAAIGWVSGYKLNFPIYIDTEGSGGRADSLGKADRTAIVKAFCETVRNSGYKPGIYASKYWYYDNLDVSQLSTYNIWVAQYNTECNYNGRYDMWQYTSQGSVPGIKGNVDMNICYTKY